MNELIFTFSKADRHALATIRHLPGWQAAETEEWLWLRGVPAGEEDLTIRQLPARQTFTLGEADLLFPVGKNVPVGKLPGLNWQPLVLFLPIVLPVSGLPGFPESKAELRLKPAATLQKGEALLTSLQALKNFAETAPEIRLRAVRFAVSETGKALVLGVPLLPLPGQEYWLNEDLLLPCGFELDPPGTAPLIVRSLNAERSGLLLFDIDGSWQKIKWEYLLPATRSGIRMSG